MNQLSGNKKEFRVVGLMSGSSLDGLDLAACLFRRENGKWSYSVEYAATLPYPPEWETKLARAHLLDGEGLMILHTGYGRYLAEKTLSFLEATGFEPDFIASHGHTLFHQPGSGMTFQAGNGAVLAILTKLPVVADFRITDVALGGQGAPLVPAGDRLLFSEFDYCLNLGGFANVSMIRDGKLVAFDTCPVNFALNHLARKTGMPFDNDGETGRSGKIIEPLLKNLDQLDFYRLVPPRSLGREWMEKVFFPCLELSGGSLPDQMRTVYEHAGRQIGRWLTGKGRVLVTGGGAFNKFLIGKISEYSEAELILPDKVTINYKEALIFAFLGVLRMIGEVNCFASVTGARKDSSCGIVFYP